jgi:type I restriction enzyme S subunit
MSIATECAKQQACWIEKPLDQCATIQTGVSKGRKIDGEELVSVPYLRVANVQDGYLNLSEIKKVQIRPNEVSRYALQPGDVLLTEGGDFDKLGRGFVWNGELPECIHQNHVFAVRVDQTQLDPHFFAYQVQSPLGKQYFLSVAHRTTNLACINTTKLKAFPVRIPPMSEQKEIVHILSTVKRAIEVQERIGETTTELKQALMQKLFSEGLWGEPQKETEIGMVPESWEVVSLSEVCQILSGGTPSKQNPEFWQGTIPWVSPKDMKRPRLKDAQDHISQEGLDNGSKLAPAGSVLVVVRGMILAKTVPVALAEVPMAINQDIKAIVPGAKLSSDFLLYALEAFRENLFKRVGRSGHGTCTLMGHEIAELMIPLPKISTQKEVIEVFSSVDAKLRASTQKQITLTALFKSTLNGLMTPSIASHSHSSNHGN